MNFSINHSIEILDKTPATLSHLVGAISSDWTFNNEGGDTWSVYDVIGHLIHGEYVNWMTKIEIILSDDVEKNFKVFDRFAQFENSKGKTLHQLLLEFKEIRNININKLRQLNIGDNDLNKTGIHPAFGTVTLQELISTWVVHDLDHIAQIARVMGKQYKAYVGPWVEYLKILKQ